MATNQKDRFLLLIRHSAVHIDRDIPSIQWKLSAEGRERCRQFASQLAPYRPTIFIASTENKAIETAELLAQSSALPVQHANDLHEHDRHGAPYFASQRDFRDAVGRFFAAPEELVFGRETAVAAGDRFNSAIEHLLTQHPVGNLAVVTHGTVLTLFICRHNAALEPISFWSKLQMPCAALLHLPNLTFQKMIFPSNM